MSISTIPLPNTRPATLDDLAKFDGKAELIDGKIVRQMATGHLLNRVASRIFRSLDDRTEISPDQPIMFIEGSEADAEPAVAGWRIPIDRVFS